MKISAVNYYRTPSFKGEMELTHKGKCYCAGYGENGREDVYEPDEYTYYPYLHESDNEIKQMLKSRPGDEVTLGVRLPYDKDTKEIYMVAKLLDKNTLLKCVRMFSIERTKENAEKYGRINNMLGYLIQSKKD